MDEEKKNTRPQNTREGKIGLLESLKKSCTRHKCYRPIISITEWNLTISNIGSFTVLTHKHLATKPLSQFHFQPDSLTCVVITSFIVFVIRSFGFVIASTDRKIARVIFLIYFLLLSHYGGEMSQTKCVVFPFLAPFKHFLVHKIKLLPLVIFKYHEIIFYIYFS